MKATTENLDDIIKTLTQPCYNAFRRPQMNKKIAEVSGGTAPPWNNNKTRDLIAETKYSWERIMVATINGTVHKTDTHTTARSSRSSARRSTPRIRKRYLPENLSRPAQNRSGIRRASRSVSSAKCNSISVAAVFAASPSARPMDLMRGMPVKDTGKFVTVPVGKATLGRVS